MANTKISALTSATTPLAGTEALPIVQSSITVKTTVAGVTQDRTGVSVGKALKSWRTTGPDYTLQVGDGAAVFSDSNVTLDLGNNWYLNSSNQFIYVGTNGATRIQCYQGNYKFFTAPSGTAGTQITWTQVFTVAQAGDVTFNTGNLVQGTAAKGINFTANTGAAGKTSQLLNWYEEGTFTPVVADAATGGNTGTAALAKGRYTRVGRNITVTIAFLDITTTGMTAGNTLYVRALPYTSVTDAFVNFIGSQANSQLASTNGAIYPVLGNNSSAIYFLDGIAAGSNNTIKVSGITSGQTDLYITLTYEAA